MKNRVVSFGEIMGRLSPPNNERIVQATNFNINYGGAETNTSVMLSNLGVETCFFTAVPNNLVGQAAVNYLNRYGINTRNIVRTGDRLGLYYFECGNSIRSSRVIYDRKNSSVTECDIEKYDFESIFEGAEWFHFTGITAALGENCLAVLKKSIKVAKSKGIKISIDLNYRRQLWSYDEFKKVVMPLLKDVDLCIGWIDLDQTGDFKMLNAAKDTLDNEYFKRVFSRMCKEFNIKYMATTLREAFSSSENALTGIIYKDGEIVRSKRYNFGIVDRVGAGDAFAAGLIYKLLEDTNMKDVVEFATAASSIKHTVLGDSNIVSEEEILDLVGNSSGGEVKR